MRIFKSSTQNDVLMFATHNLLPIVLKNPCLFFFALDIEMNWLCLSATCYFAPFTSEAVKSIKVKVIYDGMLYITWHVWTEVAASKSHLLSNFSTSFHCLLLSTLFKHLLSHWQLLHSHALCPALAVKGACVCSINISFFLFRVLRWWWQMARLSKLTARHSRVASDLWLT